MSGDVDGALNVPESEVRRHLAAVFDVPEEVLSAPQSLPTVEVEFKNVSPEAFKLITGMEPEEALGGCPPAPEEIPAQPGWQGVTSKLIHDALNEAAARGIAREEEIAKTAILLGVGYARIETWAPMTFDAESLSIANQLRVDYVITSLVPPMERFEFPSWSSFEAWRARQERRR